MMKMGDKNLWERHLPLGQAAASGDAVVDDGLGEGLKSCDKQLGIALKSVFKKTASEHCRMAYGLVTFVAM